MRSAGYKGSFSSSSRPYLFATEFPFTAITRDLVEGKRALSIAGSGDVPLHLAAQGARCILALDISRYACELCSLKFAAVREFAYRDFLWFFLAGIARAAGFLRRRGIDPEFEPGRWRELHRILLSLDIQFAGGDRECGLETGTGPFTSGVRPTELWFLEHISHVAQPAAFQMAKRSAGAITLHQREVTEYLEHAGEKWDFLYLSNLPEYIRSDALLAGGTDRWRPALERLFYGAARRLSSGGVISWYLFHDPQRVDDCLDFSATVLKNLGLHLRKKTITYRCDFPLGSRFINGLALASRSFLP